MRRGTLIAAAAKLRGLIARRCIVIEGCLLLMMMQNIVAVMVL
jgi:hypothetical protein